MAYQIVATAVTLNDLEGHSPLADVFKRNPSNICATFYTISTDSVLAWFLCISRASCLKKNKNSLFEPPFQGLRRNVYTRSIYSSLESPWSTSYSS